MNKKNVFSVCAYICASLLFFACLISENFITNPVKDELSSSVDGLSSSVDGVSSSSSSPAEPGNCYWYKDGNGNGKYNYKCGFEPPCYTNPSCPECDVCYPYPTECGWVEAPCLRDSKHGKNADCRRVYECREVVDPGKFKLVEKDACCSLPSCYEGAPCPAVCTPPIVVSLNGIESFAPIYACYREKNNH